MTTYRAHEISDWIDCRRFGAMQQGKIPGVKPVDLDNDAARAGTVVHVILAGLHSLPVDQRTEVGLHRLITDALVADGPEVQEHVRGLLQSFYKEFGLDLGWVPDKTEYEIEARTPGGNIVVGHPDEWFDPNEQALRYCPRIGDIKTTLSDRQYVQDRVYLSAQPYIYGWIVWMNLQWLPEVVFTHISKEAATRHHRLMTIREIREWDRYLTYVVDYDIQHAPAVPNYRYWHCPTRCDQFEACKRLTLGGERRPGAGITEAEFEERRQSSVDR